jgi:ribosomal protein S11
MATKSTQVKKKVKRSVASGVVHIQSTFNNTIVTSPTSATRWHGQRGVLG